MAAGCGRGPALRAKRGFAVAACKAQSDFQTGLCMQIAQIAPLTEAIPPKLYGGTERVISWLADELVALGHDVVLFASGDLQTSANLDACSAPTTRSRERPARSWVA